MANEKVIIEGNVNNENLKMYQMYKGYNQLKGLSVNTIESYEYDILQWFKFLNSYQMDKTYNEVTEEDIEEYLMYCKMNGNEASRLQRRAACVSSFYIFLRRKKKVTINPVEFIERPKKKLFVREKHFLTVDQVATIKSRIHELNNIVGETFVLLAINTAARRTALRNIKWSDIDFEEREIDVIEKGPKQVVLYISEDVKNKLLELKYYYEENNINLPHVFVSKYRGQYHHAANPSVARWVREAGYLIGIDNLTPHSLRRTAATLMMHNGMELMDVSAILNHESMDTTKIYIQRDKKKLKSIKDKICI